MTSAEKMLEINFTPKDLRSLLTVVVILLNQYDIGGWDTESMDSKVQIRQVENEVELGVGASGVQFYALRLCLPAHVCTLLWLIKTITSPKK